jgi:hypothetical protein
VSFGRAIAGSWLDLCEGSLDDLLVLGELRAHLNEIDKEIVCLPALVERQVTD